MFKYMLLCLFLPVFLFAQENNEEAKNEKLNIILGKVSQGPGADSISTYKFEAAFTLAVGMSQKYRLISADYRDSVIAALREENPNLNMIDIANACNADIVAAANVGILKNMMRVDLALADIKNKINRKGVGYGLLNYRKLDEKPLYDPTLLKATQRSFANALENDSLYQDAPEGFNVKPAAPLVVGGIEFINDMQAQDSLMTWDLFEKKVVNSYDLCESIFEEASFSPDYAVYDIDSRDSLYAMLKLFGIENYNTPSAVELQGLAKIEVEYYITGKFTQLPFAARLELSLYRINPQGSLFEIKNVKGLLKLDKIDEMRKVAKELTDELLSISEKKKQTSESDTESK